jgi:hypothetical protein
MNHSGVPTSAMLLSGVGGFLCLGYSIWYGVYFLKRAQPRLVRYLERTFDVTIHTSSVSLGYWTESGGSALTTFRVWLLLGLYAVVGFSGAIFPWLRLWWVTRQIEV